MGALDLNLLTALDALLRHRSVSAAAQEVGRTQSAMSHALARLRHHFGDPLLVRDGWNMHLTPVAEALGSDVGLAVRSVSQVFAVEGRFDPKTSAKCIRIATRDICEPLFTPLLAHLRKAAPGMRVDFVKADNIRTAVLQSQADIGLVFGQVARDVSLELSELAPMTWATFAPRDHPFVASPDEATWAESHHILVGGQGGAKGPIERVVEQRGISRRVLATADSFASALAMAANTGSVFSALLKPLEPLSRRLGLVACPLPFPMPAARTVLIGRSAFGDPFQEWLLHQTRYLAEASD